MGALLRPSKINPTQVPTCPVEIDWAHPLAAGLMALYIPGVSPVDFCGLAPPLSGSGQVYGTSIGPGLGSYSGAEGATTTAEISSAFYLNSGSMGWVGNISAGNNSGESVLIGVSDASASDDYCLTIGAPQSYQNQNVQLTFVVQYSGTGIYGTTAGGQQSLVGVFDTGGGVSTFFQNGKSVGTTTQSGGGSRLFSSASAILVGGNLAVPASYGGVTSNIGAIWSGKLTAALAELFNAEPFGMLRPIVRRAWFVPAGGPASVSAMLRSQGGGYAALTMGGRISVRARSDGSGRARQAMAGSIGAAIRSAGGGTSRPSLVRGVLAALRSVGSGAARTAMVGATTARLASRGSGRAASAMSGSISARLRSAGGGTARLLGTTGAILVAYLRSAGGGAARFAGGNTVAAAVRSEGGARARASMVGTVSARLRSAGAGSARLVGTTGAIIVAYLRSRGGGAARAAMRGAAVASIRSAGGATARASVAGTIAARIRSAGGGASRLTGHAGAILLAALRSFGGGAARAAAAVTIRVGIASAGGSVARSSMSGSVLGWLRSFAGGWTRWIGGQPPLVSDQRYVMAPPLGAWVMSAPPANLVMTPPLGGWVMTSNR